MNRTDDFKTFCRAMLGSTEHDPLVAGETLVNGAFLGALLDCFKVCCPDGTNAPGPKRTGGDPLGEVRQ